MFSSILFLILLLLLVQFTPEAPSLFSPIESLLVGLGGYVLLLVLIWGQQYFLTTRMRFSLERRLFITNIELLLFLVGYHFFLGAQQVYAQGTFEMLWRLIGAFLLYFGGLATFYRTAHKPMWGQIRFLLPFAIPALFLSLLYGLISFLPLPHLQHVLEDGDPTTPLETTIMLLFYGSLFAGLLIFFPPLMVTFWGCSKLPKGPKREQLEAFCRKAGFRHAGLCTWPVMAELSTAAIVGVTARFRYILFTKSLLEQHDLPEVEAVLAHEIGHSQHRHLLLYPVVFSGMIVLSALLYQLVGEPIRQFFVTHYVENPSPFWVDSFSTILFVLYGTVAVLYFRFVFGYFSRLFERQADLHGFALGVPPEAMIRALDRVAIHGGLIHDQPNWHHYSIRERIRFLESCQKDPKQIERHHRRVRYTLGVYFFLLALGMLFVAN